MNKELVTRARELVEWVKNDALPLWCSKKAINAQNGGCYERLLANGEPDTGANLRVRVQARQMFVYALAEHLGWMENTGPVVEGLAAFVDQYGRHPDKQGYVHLLGPDLRVVDGKQDLYDHAFFLLALCWRYRQFGDKGAKQEAESLMRDIDSRFGQQLGGWLEGDYEAECRRQNPHMHLFETFLGWYEATGEAHWLARAGEMFALFETRFYDSHNTVLLEFFNADWTPLAGDKGRITEPGHMFEWVWLLRWYERCTGREVSRYADALYAHALSVGMNENGLIYDSIYASGEVVKATKRSWPVTELIKSSIAQARAGHKEAERWAAEGIRVLQDYYLKASTPGAYVDKLDEHDRVADTLAQASTFYHLIVAAWEASDYVANSE